MGEDAWPRFFVLLCGAKAASGLASSHSMTSAVLVSTLHAERGRQPQGCTLQKLRPHTPPTAQASQAAVAR